MAETDNRFAVRIITPERVFYEGEATMIEFNTTEGEIGIFARHIPLTTVIAPGICRITEDGDQVKLAGMYSGFAEIRGDRVTLLAESAEWPDEIDRDRAKRAEERARDRLEKQPKNLDVARCEIALKKALVRQRLVG